MFWSPAVATFKVCVWAPAGPIARAAVKAPAIQSLFMSSSLVMGAWKQVQRSHGQAQTHGAFEIKTAVGRHGVATARDRDAVAVLAARIGALGDSPGQHDRALDPGVGLDELRDVVADISR